MYNFVQQSSCWKKYLTFNILLGNLFNFTDVYVWSVDYLTKRLDCCCVYLGVTSLGDLILRMNLLYIMDLIRRLSFVVKIMWLIIEDWLFVNPLCARRYLSTND